MLVALSPPAISAFTRVHSPSKTGVNALKDAPWRGEGWGGGRRSFGGEPDETSTPPFSASGRERFRSAGPLRDRQRAKLSDATDTARGPVSSGRSIRHDRPPVGGADENSARHAGDREYRGWWRLPRRGAGLARAARRLHAAAWRRDDAYHRGAAQEPAAVRLAQRLRADLRHRDHRLCAGRASLRAGERPQRADRLCEGQSGQAVLPLRRYPLPESPPRRSLQAT